MSDTKVTLLRLADVLARTGLGKSTMYQTMAKGEFPSQVKIAAHCVAWIESEVDAWIATRIALRAAKRAA